MARFVLVLAASAVLAAATPGGLRGDAQNAAIAATNVTEDVDLEGLVLFLSENLTLSAEVAAEASAALGKCHGRYMGALEGLAPGCLGQCARQGICGAFGRAISAFGSKKKDKAAAKASVCRDKRAFACLLQGSHRAKCRALYGPARGFGIPTSAGGLYGQCR